MHKPSRLLALALVFSLGLACWVERPSFVDPFALNDDVRNQVYWMARILNPHLFQQDYIADYFTQPLLVSPVVFGLYSLLALGFGFSPLLVTQFLPLVLAVVATFFLFRFCAAYRDDRYAFWVAFAFNASIWLLKNLAGGLPRAFFYPLFFCLLWAIQTRKWWVMALVLTVSALTYPPAMVLGLGVVLIETFSIRRDQPGSGAKLRGLALSLVGILAVAAWRVPSNAGMMPFGPLTDAVTAERMRDLYQGGRIVLYTLPYSAAARSFPLNAAMAVVQRLPQLYILIPLLIFGGLLLLYQRWLKPRLGALLVPGLIWRALAVSGVLYVLAWCFLFYLYVPERYLEYTLLLIPSFALGSLAYAWQSKTPHLQGRIAALFMVVLLLATGFFWRADLMKIPARERTLYTYLKTLPEDTMIAAPPGLASNIPLYASRSVLLSNEAYIPFHQKYFYEMKARLKAWLLAYYATDSRPVLAFLAKYPIDYLIVQQKDFKKKTVAQMRDKYYEAFDTPFFTALTMDPPDAYFLPRLPDTCLVYRTEFYAVIDAKRLRARQCG